MTGIPNPLNARKSRRPYLLLLLVFAVSRILYYAAGIRFDARPLLTFFQIIDPETNQEASPGKVGLLRILDLANLWSVLAVLTQDLAIAQPDGGFLLLGRDPQALPRGCSRAVDELMHFARG